MAASTGALSSPARREVESVDEKPGTVRPKDARGDLVDWKPVRIAAAKGGLEVYRSETTESRAGDRLRFTRNDPARGSPTGSSRDPTGWNRHGPADYLHFTSATREYRVHGQSDLSG